MREYETASGTVREYEYKHEPGAWVCFCLFLVPCLFSLASPFVIPCITANRQCAGLIVDGEVFLENQDYTLEGYGMVETTWGCVGKLIPMTEECGLLFRPFRDFTESPTPAPSPAPTPVRAPTPYDAAMTNYLDGNGYITSHHEYNGLLDSECLQWSANIFNPGPWVKMNKIYADRTGDGVTDGDAMAYIQMCACYTEEGCTDVQFSDISLGEGDVFDGISDNGVENCRCANYFNCNYGCTDTDNYSAGQLVEVDPDATGTWGYRYFTH
jgi:hypothetical protein